MKRPYKITLWVSGSILMLLVLIITAVSIILFNSKYLSSLVIGQLNKQERLVFSMSGADLVMFKTFPEVSLHLTDFTIEEKTSSDTLAAVPDLYAAIDVKAFLKNNELIVRKISIDDVYTDVDRLLAAFPASEETEDADTADTPFSLPFGLMDISSVRLNNLHILYGGKAAGQLNAELQGLDIDLSLSTKGNKADGKLILHLQQATVAVGDTVYCYQIPLYARIPFHADLDSMKVVLSDAALEAAGLKLHLAGMAAMPASDTETPIEMSLSLGIDRWSIEELMALIPEPFMHLTEGISADGSISLDAMAEGVFSSSSMPTVRGSLSMDNISAQTDFLPMNIDAAKADIAFDADLNTHSANAVIHSLSLESGKTIAALSGKVSDILNDPAFDIELEAGANIEELLADLEDILPDSLNVIVEGNADLNANISGKLSHITDEAYNKLTASAELAFEELGVVYSDTVIVDSPDLRLTLSLNGTRNGESSKVLAIKELSDAHIGAALSFSSLDILMGNSMYGTASNSRFRVGLADLPLGNVPLALYCDFDIEGLMAEMDTMSIAITAPHGAVAMLPSSDTKKQGRYLCDLSSSTMYAHMGSSMTLDTDSFLLKASAERDTAAANILEQWSPEMEVDFKGGIVNMSSIEDAINIPSIHLAFKDDSLQLYESSISVGNSDFNLSGLISEISEFMNKSGLLTADLDFVSNTADVDQLLAYVSGFGGTDTDSTSAADIETASDSASSEEGNPFMVPLGIDFTLNTKIDNAYAFGNKIQNVGGEVTIRDGIAIIRQLGFTSDAAKMQLTAMYKSPRKNHLFAGIDFHLVDIEIDKLIQMIPQVDSILPMLKSFAGQAEFHLGVETNLNSRYELKKSTLLGAATIEGRNLVVLDSDTFDKIAGLLNFKKSQENVIDSLMVDVTVFRNEVDIYPFIVSMDKYQLVLAGRHNLDMSFNYHLDCIAPIRLGVDVKGRIGDLKIGITPTRYKNFFVPERRNDIQERTVKLMELINTSLKEGVNL